MKFGPLPEIPVSNCLSYGPLILFSQVSSASLISQSGSFAWDCSRDLLTHESQWTPGLGLEEPPSGHSPNY